MNDFTPGKTVYIPFNSQKADGTPITLAGAPAVSIYKNGSTTESTAGVSLTVDYDSRTGYHVLAIDTSADGTFYAAGNDFTAVLTAGTVDSISVVGKRVGAFSLANRSHLRPATADRTIDVDASGKVLLQATQEGVTIPTVTTLTNLPSIPDNWLTAAGIAADAITAAKIADGAIDAATFASGAIDAAAIATDAIDADSIKADAITEIQSGLATASSLSTVATAVNSIGVIVTAIQTVLSGITSLAQWLGLIAGKQTGNSTALAELRGTGAASGTFDPTTDALEAIRDRGDAAWTGGGGGGGGTGANTVTITVDDGTDPLENAKVRMTNGAESYLVETDADGEAVFALDDATWAVAITKPGYQFTPTTLIVNGAETQTYSMDAITITPGDATTTTGYVTVRDSAGAVVAGAVVQVQITKLANGTTGAGIDNPLAEKTTGVTGLAEFPGLPRLATYRVRIGDGEWFTGKTADATTTALMGVLGVAE